MRPHPRWRMGGIVDASRTGSPEKPSLKRRAVSCACGRREKRMTIQKFFAPDGEMLIGHADSPLTLRLILQPIVAAIIAICAGLKTRGTKNETTKLTKL